MNIVGCTIKALYLVLLTMHFLIDKTPVRRTFLCISLSKLSKERFDKLASFNKYNKEKFYSKTLKNELYTTCILNPKIHHFFQVAPFDKMYDDNPS